MRKNKERLLCEAQQQSFAFYEDLTPKIEENLLFDFYLEQYEQDKDIDTEELDK